MANEVGGDGPVVRPEIRPLTPDEWREAILSTLERDDA